MQVDCLIKPSHQKNQDRWTRWQIRKGCRFENGLISQYNRIGCVNEIKTTQDVNQQKNNEISQLKENSKISFTLPIITVSEANTVYSKTRLIKTGKNKGKPAREHWTEAHARHRAQKNAIYYACATIPSKVHLPCNVKLIRLGPREMDYDNLVISQKYCRDALAELLTGDYVPGRADSDKRITWQYDQEKSKEYGVKIEICWN